MSNLSGIEIRVDRHMVGMKKAVRFGDGPIYVSPAMYDLIQHHDGSDLEWLLSRIPLAQLPALPDFSAPLGMTTCFNEPIA